MPAGVVWYNSPTRNDSAHRVAFYSRSSSVRACIKARKKRSLALETVIVGGRALWYARYPGGFDASSTGCSVEFVGVAQKRCWFARQFVEIGRQAAAMSRQSKLLRKILDGESDANIRFADLCRLLVRLGFAMRVRGSHHLFRHPSVVERVTLQSSGDKAKSYQVRQVRRILLMHDMTVLRGDRDAD